MKIFVYDRVAQVIIFLRLITLWRKVAENICLYKVYAEFSIFKYLMDFGGVLVIWTSDKDSCF